MHSYQLYFTLFVIVSPIFALKGYDFVFKRVHGKAPRAVPGGDFHIITKDWNLTEFSCCVWLAIETVPETHFVTILSYASRKSGADNGFSLDISYGETNFTCVTRNRLRDCIRKAPLRQKWTHLCSTWDGKNDEEHFYFDGEHQGLIRRSVARKIAGDGFLVLGQDQDAFNDEFKSNAGFKGKLTQLNLWTTTLTKDEVFDVWMCKMQGDLLNWENAGWILVDILEVHWSDAPCMDFTCKLRRCYPRHNILSSKMDIIDAGLLKESALTPHRRQNSSISISLRFGIPRKTLRNVNSFSICAWIYFNFTELGRGYFTEDRQPLFYCSSRSPSGLQEDGEMQVSILLNGSFTVSTRLPTFNSSWLTEGFKLDVIGKWHHVCYLWLSDEGQTQIYANGELVDDRYGMAKEVQFEQMNFQLRQLQYAVIKPPNFIKGVILKIADFNVWRKFLKPKEVESVYCDAALKGDAIRAVYHKMYICKWWKKQCDAGNIPKIGTSSCPANHSVTSPLDIMTAEQWEKHQVSNVNTTDGRPVAVSHGIYAKAMKPVRAFTMCAWFYTDFTPLDTTLYNYFAKPLFSCFSSPSARSEPSILISLDANTDGLFQLTFNVNVKRQVWNISEEARLDMGDWQHLCLTWESDSGYIDLIVNGQFRQPIFGMATGMKLPTMSCNVHHLQYGIIKQADDINNVGQKMVDFHVWDKAFVLANVKEIYCNTTSSGNVINWKTSKMSEHSLKMADG